ncbi:hypothetical protein QYE76_036036 [Lolium multiflorum]|uniref:LSM domain-containing protein n=1 Tax=Lolium multiflorum TaxID=4521 RepID=A0AAD8VPS9_LOLMU|nr:hypothetical protein QYE76_036036 [Lolium multiflorum]
MNAAALTALVNRWRPETHTFHLRAGEMIPTLQDVSMILGLPIQDEPLCMNTASDGRRQQMQALIGMAPPAPANPKERVPAGASFAWIRLNFGQCPDGANVDTIRTYTRVYLCWTKLVAGLGAAVLVDACSYFPYGAGTSYQLGGLGHSPRGHGLITMRTLIGSRLGAYLWDNVSEMTSDPNIMYRHYTEELDTLTAEQVDWEPYGTYYRIGAAMPNLNQKCTEEARFWRMRCPLICLWLVEYHQPHRVIRQFGLYQECPPQWQDTDKELHRLDRQQQRKITNWPVHHSGHVTAFQHCLEATRNGGTVEIVPHDLAAFNNYLQWFHENMRIELVKHAYDDNILDDPIEFDEVAQSQHDTYARRGRSTSIASELNFVRSEIQETADECEVMWDQSLRDEKPVGPLQHFIKIPDDEEILSQSISRGKKQAPRLAYQLKPRGKAPNRYTPEDYVNRGKKVVIEEDEGPPWRSSLSRMRNDEPLSSEEEEQEEQQQQEPRQRTKRMAVRKQPKAQAQARFAPFHLPPISSPSSDRHQPPCFLLSPGHAAARCLPRPRRPVRSWRVRYPPRPPFPCSEGAFVGAMEGPSDGHIPLGPGDAYINSSTAPADTTSRSSPHVSRLQKLLYRRMLVGVNDGRYFLGLFHCIDKQGNIILQDAVEYRSARHSSSSPMEQRCLGLILIPAACRSSCHVDCFIEEQMSLLSLDK